MKATFAILVLAATALFAGQNAMATTDFVSSLNVRHAKPACTIPANAYALCHYECAPAHTPGSGIQDSRCIDDCVARSCK